MPICAHCKQIRANAGPWSPIAEYIQRHAGVTFSHGLCQNCAYQHCPTFYELQKNFVVSGRPAIKEPTGYYCEATAAPGHPTCCWWNYYISPASL